MNQYRLEEETFIIDEFDKKVPFCSFLPGLAGEKGIPMWSFYVNRGQCMTSFGFNNKNNPIMEFAPANIAYENTSTKGFRTFVKKNNEYFEPFFTTAQKGIKRTMYIKQNTMKIVEIDDIHSFKTTVEYFILPEESVGAVVRNVKFENLGEKADFEILDGMPRVIAYGMNGDDFLRMAYLMRSYNTMLNIENKIPVFLNQISGDDDDEVKVNTGGYYYLSFDNDGIICPIYDPNAVFGEETSFVTPVNFVDNSLDGVKSYKQHSTNKICCCFTPIKKSLAKGEAYEINSLVGYTDSCELINQKAVDVIKKDYIDRKLKRADEISAELTCDIESHSGNKLMDMYARQCYMDNFLRGGYPFTFDDKVVHIFSRKHGDPERDYNFFSIAGEYYSQGDGNFRDVSQNRRNDVVFHPECNDFDIWMFFSLMQFDGYNPLNVKGTTFAIKDNCKVKVGKIIENSVVGDAEFVKNLVADKFTAGSLINGMYNNGITLKIDDNEFLGKILPLCNQNIEASSDKFGFWSDHWDYNMDLIEAYLKIYPDKLQSLLFDNGEYLYFDDDVVVNPRSKKYLFNGKEVRQLKTFEIDEEKYRRGYVKDGTNWLKDEQGNIYKTNLIEKLISLSVNKFALLDQGGMGIEMEAGRAGWCDACNGLPSMFGSGMSETFELRRLLKFLKKVSIMFSDENVKIPVELNDFINKIANVLSQKELSQFDYWDKIATIREDFRELTKYNISGKTTEISLEFVSKLCDEFIKKVDDGIKKARKIGNGLMPTYLRYKATKFDVSEQKEPGEYPVAKVYAFEPDMVPYFLEGPVKNMANAKDTEEAIDIFNKVKASDIYDKKLKMYKTSVPLDSETVEFGRLKAFTPGWQEHESVFLHMEYKYFVAMMNAGVYDIAFNELKNAYIPFQKPEVYGRSILENCSFLASSANPDENLHGRGFVSRLSGSTTEVISIWVDMFLGKTPFIYENGKLGLNIKPILPSWMFDENGEASFKFLSNSKVTLHNPKKIDTYKTDIKYVCIDGKKYESDKVFDDVVVQIRNGKKVDLDIYY